MKLTTSIIERRILIAFYDPQRKRGPVGPDGTEWESSSGAEVGGDVVWCDFASLDRA